MLCFHVTIVLIFAFLPYYQGIDFIPVALLLNHLPVFIYNFEKKVSIHCNMHFYGCRNHNKVDLWT